MKLSRILTLTFFACAALSGCASVAKKPASEGLVRSALKIRSLQTRAFDTADENRTLRAIIATLQDFGFVIENADEALATITARRIDKYPIRLMVTVRARRTTQVLVRLNVHYNVPVRDPVIYQNFFTSLANSMFLTANPIQ